MVIPRAVHRICGRGLRASGGIKTIIDIGANNAEFAQYLSSYFDATRTIVIELLRGVLRGGEGTFRAAKFVLIEMSFVPMYDEQPLFEEVHQLSAAIGFRFGGIKNQVNSPRTGQPLFMHCLYINTNGR